MKRGAFIFEGVPSEEIKAIIQTRPLLEAPARKVESRTVYGVDGDIPFDEGAYANTPLDLIMLIDGDDLIADRQKFYNLIDTKGGYRELIPYFDPGKIYRVRLESASFENQHFYGEKQTVSTKFTVKPYKYLVDNDPIELVTGGLISNPTNYISQPLITITGSGPVTLVIDEFEFHIKNVVNEITIDSERYFAYQKEAVTGALINMNHQILTKEYPILQPGQNDISVTGSVTKLIIEPRWRSLV